MAKPPVILPDPLPKGFKPKSIAEAKAMLDRKIGKDRKPPHKGTPYWGRATSLMKGDGK